MNMAPTLVTSCTTLPPEGAVRALGRPGAARFPTGLPYENTD